MTRLLIALCAAAACAPALAAPLTPLERQLVGDWTIARTSEWPDVCALRLLADETIGGQGVTLRRGCKKAFAWTDDIAAWHQGASDKELVLQDAVRHALIHFLQDESGDWVGTGPDGQDYVIQRTPPARKKR